MKRTSFLAMNLRVVAQIFNLLYRRLAVGWASVTSNRRGNFNDPQNTILRYGRLKICATKQSASPLRFTGALRNIACRVLFLALAATALALPLRAADDAKPKSKPPERPLDAKAAPLNIAFVSYANPQQVARDSEGVTKYLQKYLGAPVKGFVTLDYGSAIEAMRNAKADLAFVDPLAFMMAHEQMGARPLLLEIYGSGKPAYHSCIWVRKDSALKQLADLRGKSIAFADQVDMSGHLMPRHVFVSAGLLSAKRIEGEFFKQVYFAGGDEQAMRAMFNGFTDAAGVSQYSLGLLRGEERDQVMALTNSIESPSHLLMARPGLANEQVDRIKQVLLALDKSNPADKAMLDKLYGVHGYAEANLTNFQEIAVVAASYGFVKKPELFSAGKAKP